MKKKNKKLVIILLLLVCVGMGIGYSILSKQLKIEGRATLETNFDVAITGIEKAEYYKTKEYSSIGAGTMEAIFRENETPSYTSTTATFDVSLNRYGSGAYWVTLKNTGSERAIFDSIDVVNDGSNNIVVDTPVDLNGTTLNAGQSVKYLVIISADGDNGVSEDAETSNITVTFNLRQFVSNDIYKENTFIVFGSQLGNDAVKHENSDTFYDNAIEVWIENREQYGTLSLLASIDGGNYTVQREVDYSDSPGSSSVAYAWDYSEFEPGTHVVKLAIGTAGSTTPISNEIEYIINK